MRSFLGILAGIILGLAAQATVDLIASQLYPAAITDLWDRRQVAEAMAERPTGALLLTLLGFFTGALVGGLTAKWISRRGWTVWVPAGVLAVMALVIAFNFPMPAWALFGTFVAPLIGGFVARHVGASADGPQAAPSEVEAPSDA